MPSVGISREHLRDAVDTLMQLPIEDRDRALVYVDASIMAAEAEDWEADEMEVLLELRRHVADG
jgi:hypothetical protein